MGERLGGLSHGQKDGDWIDRAAARCKNQLAWRGMYRDWNGIVSGKNGEREGQTDGQMERGMV